MPFVRNLGKTNMLTKIPQDISLELKDGVLTLKAGSRVYVPNGFEADGVTPKFDVVTAVTDINYPGSAKNDTIMMDVSYNTSTFEIIAIHGNELNLHFSGNTPPSLGLFYNTTDNTIKLYVDGSVNRYGSFPIAIINRSSTSQGSGYVTSIDKVFNGFGYIGSTIFALPNVKGLMPDGRNEDGTLKNIEWITQNLILRNNTESGTWYLAILDNGTRVSIADKSTWSFDEKSNSILGDGVIRDNIGFYGDITLTTGGVITSFTPKKVGEGYIENKLYQLAANKRTYYKYEYRNWVQPVLTSSTSSKKVIITSTSDYDSGYANWRVLDGSSTPWLSGNGTGQGSVRMEFPRPLKISSISVTGWSNQNGGTANVTIYKDLDNTEVVGTTQYFGGSVEKTWVFDTPVITDKLSFHITGTTVWGCASEIKIIAQEQIAVEVNLNGEDVYEDWEQPILTENGIMGGDKFACTESAYYDGDTIPQKAWLMFAGKDNAEEWQINNVSTSSTYWASWYNPKPLKITALQVQNATGEYSPIKLVLQGSDDNSTWVDLGTADNDNTTTDDWWDVVIDETEPYRYYRIVVTPRNTTSVMLAKLKITAQELVKVGSTDYDTYKDKLVSYAPIVRGKRSYYKQSEKQQDTGTYTFTLDKDYTAKLLFVGNGGGGCSSQKDSRWHYSSGGSGACFEGTVRLPADTYTLTIGSLGYGNNSNNTHYHSSSVVSTDSYLTNSSGVELIRVGAGGNGYTSVGGVGGAAGVLTMGALDVVETKKATDGVYTAGNTSAGSVSAYDGTYTGYGAGTGSTRGAGNVYGIAGIFDLVLETDINNYTYYEDVGTKIY